MIRMTGARALFLLIRATNPLFSQAQFRCGCARGRYQGGARVLRTAGRAVLRARLVSGWSMTGNDGSRYFGLCGRGLPHIETREWSLSCKSQTDCGSGRESWESHRTHMGDSPGITLRIPGAPPASAGPHNIVQASGKQAKGSSSVFGPLWKVGRRRLALSARQKAVRPARDERFPRA